MCALHTYNEKKHANKINNIKELTSKQLCDTYTKNSVVNVTTIFSSGKINCQISP